MNTLSKIENLLSTRKTFVKLSSFLVKFFSTKDLLTVLLFLILFSQLVLFILVLTQYFFQEVP